MKRRKIAVKANSENVREVEIRTIYNAIRNAYDIVEGCSDATFNYLRLGKIYDELRTTVQELATELEL